MTFFKRSDIRESDLLRNGHIANARVYVVSVEGRKWTIKDFADRPFLVRFFIAPFLLHRELRLIKRLAGVPGIAQEAFMLDKNALAIEYQEGESLKVMERSGYELPFLREMEALMHAIHAKGVVHLDARGTGNWLIGADGKPRLIDFQAALNTSWMPAFLRRGLEAIDISGVYRKWVASFPETMTSEQKATYEYGLKLRRMWIFHGYGRIKIKKTDQPH